MLRRIFIAINLPVSIKKSLSSAQEELVSLFEENREAIKWTKLENFHITLVFAGNVKDQELGEISQAVKEIASQHNPFSLKLERLEYGPPDLIPPRIIWATGEKTKELASLQKELQEKIIGESNKFEFHITLGRVRKWQWKRIEPEERPDIKKNISLEFPVDSIDIMESQLKRGGPLYTLLESHQL